MIPQVQHPANCVIGPTQDVARRAFTATICHLVIFQAIPQIYQVNPAPFPTSFQMSILIHGCVIGPTQEVARRAFTVTICHLVIFQAVPQIYQVNPAPFPTSFQMSILIPTNPMVPFAFLHRNYHHSNLKQVKQSS